MQIACSKYHGCGNDFVILMEKEVAAFDEEKLKDFIVSVCDRHTGIGADGCIFIRENPLEMVYYNQDGSRADMCGNGIRCFVKYCYDNEITREGIFPIQTLAGEKVAAVLSKDPFVVQIAMGKAVFSNEKIGVNQDVPIWNYELEAEGRKIPVYSMYMSTIHTVVFCEDAFDPQNEALGKAICTHPLFENQTNVNFVEVKNPDSIRACTYERGCGMTLACGTGMCASVQACLMEGKSGRHVDVEMKKGKLHIDIDTDGTVYLTGPAKLIMKGTYEYEYEQETAA